MSLNFAAAVPHPPIIIPEIGKDDLVIAEKTVSAMKKLAEKFEQADVDSIIIISPHAELRSYAMTVFTPRDYSGDFASFGAPEIEQKYSCDKDLALKIASSCQKADIPIEIETQDLPLDHGVMVPLRYFTNAISRKVKIVEIAFSALPRADHLELGRIIGNVASHEDDRIAIIASGDLSHRIFDEHYSHYGKKFDQDIANLIKDNRLSEISNIDEELVDLAGECGFRSLLILIGALNEKHFKPEFLSYEAPFGVGYLVANFEL